MISASIDATQVIANLKNVSKYITEEVNKALEVLLPKIQAYARKNHRFRTRTGKLESSIMQDVRNIIGDIYINEAIAPYGKYVHEGHGKWAPDKFIYDAVNVFSIEIKRELEQAVNRATLRAGF